MIPPWLKEEITENYVTYVKYVRIADEYRFVNTFGNHSDLVWSGEIAQSAAFCKIYKDRVEVEGYSSTLGICSAPEDEAALTKLFLGV